jgi:hypothetical protein
MEIGEIFPETSRDYANLRQTEKDGIMTPTVRNGSPEVM